MKIDIMAMVEEFRVAANQEKDFIMSADLIAEEFEEWYDWSPIGIGNYTDPTEEELKELADLVYVCFGYANARGWHLGEAVRRVHNNNMGRMEQPDGTIKYREDGKVMKNKEYPPVDLSDLV